MGMAPRSEHDDSTRLRLLLVEDSESDAELITFWLKRAGFSVHSMRVESEKEMRHAMSTRKFDIILSDYVLPAFSGTAALQVVKELSPDTPLIIVSNNIGEETAVALMLEGARDYVLKNNISRLIPAIEREVTEAAARASAESARRQSEDLFRKAFHASPAMITISHLSDDFATGYFIDVNEAFLKAVGYTREEVIGKSANDLCLFAGEEQRDMLISLLREKGYGSEIEMPFRTRQGEIRYALGSIELIEIAGTPCVLIVCQDITERKNANEELQRHREHLEEIVAQRTEELSAAISELEAEIADRKRIEKSLVDAMAYAETANKAKSEFLANMSHELRTPLNSIIGFAELLMLESKDGEDSDTREKITYILDSAWMLLSLLNDILDLSKIEAGKMILECETVSLQSLIDSSLVMLREKAHKGQIELSYINNVSDDDVYIDPRKVKQILFNLLGNAIKFTPEKGQVTLHAVPLDTDDYQQYCVLPELPDSRFSRFIRLDVVDTGIGIEPQDMAKLFQPFQQVDSALNRKYEGSGLGLHLSRQFARLHNGCIVTDSKVGEGSTFSVLLPCGAPP